MTSQKLFQLESWVSYSDLLEMKNQTLEEIEECTLLTGTIKVTWGDFHHGWIPEVPEDKECDDLTSLEWLDQWCHHLTNIARLLKSDGYAAGTNLEGGRFLMEFRKINNNVFFRELGVETSSHIYSKQPVNSTVLYSSLEPVKFDVFCNEIADFIENLLNKAIAVVPHFKQWSNFEKLKASIVNLRQLNP
ncbi:MAG: hypothetical protein EOP04_22860 [Proteobacteria bacterium]|nr:MAG: hypothetical protein EOP04_22860 [Pseudomonadota bacterium]